MAACPLLIDSDDDAVGLSLADVSAEALAIRWVGTKMAFDYVQPSQLWTTGVQGGVLGGASDAVGRFWSRSPSTANVDSPMMLPGFWVACSDAVLRTQACTCTLPATHIELPQPWGDAKAKAIPWLPVDALYVTRSDALSTTAPSLVGNTMSATNVRLQAPLSSDATKADKYLPSVCLVGWPASYACPTGFVWQPPAPTQPAGMCTPSISFGDSSWGIACPDGIPYRESPSDAAYCVFCPVGLVPIRNSSFCAACPTGTFEVSGACARKAVLSCPPLYMLLDLGPTKENVCAPSPITQCVNPVLFDTYVACLTLAPMAGFSVFGVSESYWWYTACGDAPPSAVWTPAPFATSCHSTCLYSSSPDATG